MYIKLTNGQPETYTIGQLRRDNPQTSFPRNIPAELLARYGVYPVKRTPQPEYNALIELVRLCDPVQINGEWVQHWETVELPVSQQIKNLQAARAEAYRNESDSLFFKAQRDEADLSEWQAKVQEIRDRCPYPTEEIEYV